MEFSADTPLDDIKLAAIKTIAALKVFHDQFPT
jgi:hypothetical protein